MNNFLPPIVFLVEANAKQAIAEFGKVNTQLTAMETKALKAGKSVSTFNKAAVIGTSVLKGFAVAFTALAAIGVKSLMDIEKSYGRLSQAMSNQGLATKENLKATSELVDSYESLGFGSEKAADALSVLVTATGDLEKSNRLLAISADLARAGTMSMQDAARLLARAQTGSAKLFTQFGITLDNTIPKAQAVTKAMAELEARLKGQAKAYAQTTAGQLAILKESFGDLAEAVGGPVLKAFNKFLVMIKTVGGFLADNQAILFGVATVITGVMIPAVVTLTKKLWLNAAAFVAANATLLIIVGAVAAVGAAFVWAWNKFDWFRKGFATGLQQMVKGVGYLVKAFAQIGESMIKFFLTPFRTLLEGLSHLPKVGKYAQTALDFLDKGIEGVSNSVDSAGNKIIEFGEGLYDLSSKKIDIDFSIPQLKDVGNGVAGLTDDVTGLSDALITAIQKIKDFNNQVKSMAVDLKGTWASIVGKDFNAAIKEGLLNPVDKLVTKTKAAVASYQSASNQYQSALSKLTAAQNSYTNAVKSGNKAIIASSASALKGAEDLVTGLQKGMESALGDIKQLQDDMIAAIVDAEMQIIDLKKQRALALSDSLKEELALQKDYNLKVLALQQDAAKRSAEIVKQSVDQMRGVFKSATYRNVGDIFSGLTFEGKYLAGGSLEAITNALAKQTEKATSFADKAGKLQALGFTQTFIEEIISQGPDVGGALADTILAGSPEAITKLNQYWIALEKVSSHGVDAIAKKLNSGLTLATEELTAQLAQVQTDLTVALADAFTEYTDSLTKIREQTAAQIKLIDDEISQLITKIGQLKDALASLAGLQAPGTTGGGSPTTTIQTPLEQQLGQLSPKLLEAVTSGANAIQVGESTRLQMLSQGASVSGAASSARYTAQGVAYYQAQLAQAKAAGVTVNITANTNASSQQIAADAAWAMKTSSDVQYNVTSGAYTQRSSQYNMTGRD